jgi:hypothetical protein
MAALPPLGHYNPQLADALKRLSTAKYGRPRKVVEQEIFERLKASEPPKPKFGAPGGAIGAPRGAAGGGGSSFLDEWLAKRREEMAKKGAASRPRVTAQPREPDKPKEKFAKPRLKTGAEGLPEPRTKVTAADKAGSANVSGEQHDKEDIKAISKALKDKLKTDASDTKAIGVEERKKVKQAVNYGDDDDTLNEEDQIVIDKEGNLHYPNVEL